jgi:heme-degrading monooxygenase HmoA
VTNEKSLKPLMRSSSRLVRATVISQGAGFVEFHLLKDPNAQDHTPYASHTVWEHRSAFDARTKSGALRAAQTGTKVSVLG